MRELYAGVSQRFGFGNLAKSFKRHSQKLRAVVAAMAIDWLIYCGLNQIGINMSYSVFFAVLVAVWLIVNEIISILENLSRIGVPIP